MFGLMDQWDKYLEDFSATEAWLPERYGVAGTTGCLALVPHAGMAAAQGALELC